ncbi:MAG: hypothetical protein WC299_01740 [Kiritimatiellia bacterium]
MAALLAGAIAGAETTNSSDVTPAAATPKEKLAEMGEMLGRRQYKELVAEFKDEDFAGWEKRADAFCQRGRAYAALKVGEKADADLKKALELSPGNGWFWNCMADNCSDNLRDNQKAVEAYLKCFELDKVAHQGKTSYSFLPVSAIVSAARILCGQGKYEEALEVLDKYKVEDLNKTGAYWRTGLLRAYAQVYLGQGREEEALAKFKEALEVEVKK